MSKRRQRTDRRKKKSKINSNDHRFTDKDLSQARIATQFSAVGLFISLGIDAWYISLASAKYHHLHIPALAIAVPVMFLLFFGVAALGWRATSISIKTNGCRGDPQIPRHLD